MVLVMGIFFFICKYFIRWGCGGVGDDFYSYGFDGLNMYCGKFKFIFRNVFLAGKSRQVGNRLFHKSDIIGCSLDLIQPEIKFSLNGATIPFVYKNFNTDGFFFPVMSLSAKVSCRFIFGRNHGRLKFGPPPGLSPLVEAINSVLKVEECLSFGELSKNIFAGPSTNLHTIKPFVRF